MLNPKLKEVLTSPPDGAISIVSQGENEPHLANSWNSYVTITPDGRLLMPAGGMNQTEQNVNKNNRVLLSIANRDVQGHRYLGTGLLVQGTAKFLKDGTDFAMVKERFPWARAALEVTIITAEQTL